jgi:two-component system chemotaxis sensor kinase CheA
LNDPAPKPDAVLLSENLSRLSAFAVKTDPHRLEEVLELAELFDQWTALARKQGGPWAAALVLQSSQILRGLRNGRPPHQGLERILQGLLDAGRHLEKDETQKTQPRVPGSDVFFFDVESSAFPVAAPKEGGPATLAVKEGDRPGFVEFLQEVPPYFDALETGLLHLEQSGAWDPIALYRPFHTLKSLFGYLGFQGMSDLSHQAENLLEPFKRGAPGKPTGPQVGSLLKAVDLFRLQVQKIQEGLPRGVIELCPLPTLRVETPPLAAGTSPKPALESVPSNAVPEDQDSTILVGVEKMDRLMESIEEWSVYHTSLRNWAQENGVDPTLNEWIQGMGKTARRLQDQVLSLRMVPVQPLFTRIGRVARDLSRKTGKPLQLQMEGGHTELDKRLVDELWEAVLHLLRNAVDHGLETPSERAQGGKSEYGTLKVKAWHQGGTFTLTLRDDGRGLNLDKIRDKARTLGWLGENEIAEPSRLHEFIFHPGFTTQEEATSVSGRGIGLDVVRKRIQTLKGTVQVASKPGKGCLFTLRIPLTLALMEGVLVRAGRGLYLLPLNQINRFQNEGTAEGGENPPLGGSPAPTVDLAEWLGGVPDPRRQSVGIWLGEGDRQVLLGVDEIIGKREVVLRGLEGLMEGLPGVNGGALLGDGRVCLILDIQSFLRDGALPGKRAS